MRSILQRVCNTGKVIYGDIFRKSLLFLIFLSLVYAASAFAVGNLRLGSMEIHPFFSIREGYSSNVHLNSKGEEKASGYRAFTPGIRCNWDRTRLWFKLGYYYEIFRYDRKDVATDLLGKDLYDLDSQYGLRFGRAGHDFKVDGGYRNRRTTEPSTSEELAENRKEQDIRFGLSLSIMDRFNISVNPGLRTERYDYEALAAQRDRDITSVTTTFGIRPFTKTSIILRYGYSKNEYKNTERAENDDSKTHSISTGLSWAATAKLSGSIAAGYQWKKYVRGAEETRSPNTWRLEADLRQNFSEYTSLTLSMDRRITDTTYNDVKYYYENIVRLGLSHRLTYKVRTWFDIGFDYADYRQDPRTDSKWNVGLGFNYRFLEWVSGQVGYSSQIRDSNVENNYRANQISMGLNFVF